MRLQYDSDQQDERQHYLDSALKQYQADAIAKAKGEQK